MKKILAISFIVLSIFFCETAGVNATTANYFGVSNYSLCSYGNRAGRQYCENLAAQLTAPNRQPTSKIVTTSNMCTDSGAYASRAASLAGTANLFVFAGHGLKYNYFSSFNSRPQLHFYASSSSDSWHTAASEDADKYNLGSNEITFNNNAKWAILYTCNWLTNDGSTTLEQNSYNLFNNGLHLMCGFGSRIYLDSREGTVLGDYLRDSYTIKQSFFSAAQAFQPQLDPSSGTNGNVYAKVMGANISENDMFDSYSSQPLPYSSNPGTYNTWMITIPCTGT